MQGHSSQPPPAISRCVGIPMRNPHYLCVISGLLLLATGCATITRGDKQIVKIVTDPTSATLVVDGKPFVTPADVVLKRKQAHEITLSKDGYQTITFKLNAHWDAGGVGAVAMDAAVPGGSVMFVVDFLYGADRKFNDIATIKLPKAVGPAAPALTLYEFKGKLLAKVEFDAAVEQDKLFAKKTATTKPTDAKSDLHQTATTN